MTAESIKKSKSLSVFKDSAVCLVVLTAATLAGYAFKAFQLADADIIMLYIIAVLVISIFTSKIQFCLISSVVGVVLFNYFFTYPEFSLSAHDAGYPVTFVTMFITAFIAGTLANKLKCNTLIAEQNAREKEEAALLAQNEQLRANMLRSISHDLRTPLTSISGNASTLLSGGDTLDESARQQIAAIRLMNQHVSRYTRIFIPNQCGLSEWWKISYMPHELRTAECSSISR